MKHLILILLITYISSSDEPWESFKLHNYEKSIKELRNKEKTDENTWWIYYGLGKNYEKLNNSDSSFFYYMKSRIQSSNQKEFRMSTRALAHEMLRLSLSEVSVKYFEDLIKIDSGKGVKQQLSANYLINNNINKLNILFSNYQIKQDSLLNNYCLYLFLKKDTKELKDILSNYHLSDDTNYLITNIIGLDVPKDLKVKEDIYFHLVELKNGNYDSFFKEYTRLLNENNFKDLSFVNIIIDTYKLIDKEKFANLLAKKNIQQAKYIQSKFSNYFDLYILASQQEKSTKSKLSFFKSYSIIISLIIVILITLIGLFIFTKYKNKKLNLALNSLIKLNNSRKEFLINHNKELQNAVFYSHQHQDDLTGEILDKFIENIENQNINENIILDNLKQELDESVHIKLRLGE
ncbi:hypothetical protein OAQ99_04470 [Candidatus Kapabacteria bacterium]|nr:hypothetical protein [Candidatus Kapabacteria bacterium]